MTDSLPERVESILWQRHSNPRSGWSRIPTGPVIVYAVYRRNWRLLFVALVWAALNPFVFPPPESDDAWMTRAVLAERWWMRAEGNPTVGTGYPNVCNTTSAVTFLYGLYAAWNKRPVRAALYTLIAVASKLWWLLVLIRRYDAVAENSR